MWRRNVRVNSNGINPPDAPMSRAAAYFLRCAASGACERPGNGIVPVKASYRGVHTPRSPKLTGNKNSLPNDAGRLLRKRLLRCRLFLAAGPDHARPGFLLDFVKRPSLGQLRL